MIIDDAQDTIGQVKGVVAVGPDAEETARLFSPAC